MSVSGCALLGSVEQLSKQVTDPEQLIEHRKSMDIVQSDQAAVYAMLRPDKQLYAEWELSKISKGNTKLSDGWKESALVFGHGKEHVNKEEQLVTGQESQTVSEQKRGTEHHGQDKMSVTVELVHVVKTWSTLITKASAWS